MTERLKRSAVRPTFENPPETWVGIVRACELLNKSPKDVQAMIASGLLETKAIGWRTLVSVSSIEGARKGLTK